MMIHASGHGAEPGRTAASMAPAGRMAGWCVLLLLGSASAIPRGAGADPNQGRPTPEQVEAQMQKFLSQIEQSMREWPREEVSHELPVEERTHAQVKRICDEIQQATEQQIRQTSLPQAKIALCSIYYVVRGSDRYIDVSYSGKADTTAMRSEFISCHVKLEPREGRLHLRPESGRQVSPFADILVPTLWAQTKSTLAAAAYPEPLSWPISEEVHDTILSQTGRLLSLYLKTLREFLEPSDSVAGQIQGINYEFWFEKTGEVLATIRVTFDVKGTQQDYLRPGVELDYQANRLRLKGLIHPSWSRGTEYVRDASDSAMDEAVDQWVGGFTREGPIRDARVGPPFPWVENAKDLPGGLGRIVHLTRRSHPFLGEHHRKCRLELADGRTRTFRLLTDGGSVTRTDIFLVQRDNRRFLRLRDDDQTDSAICLDTLRLCSPAGLPSGELALSIPE